MNCINGLFGFVLLLFVFFSPEVTAKYTIDDVNNSVLRVDKKLVGQLDYVDWNIEETRLDADVLTFAIESKINTQKYNDLTILYARSQALFVLNQIRINANKKVIIEEAVIAKEGFFTLAVSTGNPNFLYHAGFIAFNHLDDKILAYDYWAQCAELGHAGCGNTIASANFNGDHHFSKNIEKSIYWHQKVVSSGTRYFCSGIYSANFLGTLAALLPEYFEDGKASYWFSKELSLRKELSDKNKGTTDLCHEGDSLLSRHVAKQFISEFENTESYTQQQISELNKYKKHFSYLEGHTSAKEIIEHIDNKLVKWRKCNSYLNLYLLKNIDKNNESSVKDANLFKQALYDENETKCETTFALIGYLQLAGKWD